MQVAVNSSHNSQRYELHFAFLMPQQRWMISIFKMPQCWREALASQLAWTVLWRGCLHPHVKGHSWDKAVTFPPLLRKSIQDKCFLSRPKSLLFHNLSGNLGNTISALSGCEQPFGYGQLCRSIQSFWSSCSHQSQKSSQASHDDLFRRSTGYISDIQTLTSLYFRFWFYFKLFISCMVSTSIATLTPVCSGAFPGANVSWYRLS